MVSQSKREYPARIKDRYRHANRKGKSRLLDEFCSVCGHHRKHAIRLLGTDGRRRRRKPGRRSQYGPEEIRVLEDIWLNADRPCASRLVGMIPLWLPSYEKRKGEREEQCRQKLLSIRPRTLDWLMSPVRRKHGRRGLSGTRHGDYRVHGIPLKISHGDVSEPGFIPADTVAHCGGSMDGDFVWSLTFTDIFTGWTENRAVWNKGQAGVYEALRNIEDQRPFGLQGFHTDNGGEFLNHHLPRFYQDPKAPVQMTRGRPGKKNDNPHVAQNNYTHVRLLLGYQRIEEAALLKQINRLYEASSTLQNFFCCSRRLIHKERRGARYYRKFDDPATPSQRLLASGQLDPEKQAELITKTEALDPYALRAYIDSQQTRILSRLR